MSNSYEISEERVLSTVGLMKQLAEREKNNAPDKKMTLRLPAMDIKDCTVGPNTAERIKGQPFWGSAGNRKRKRNVNDSTDTNNGDKISSKRFQASDTFSDAMETFLSSGCCIIPDVLPKKFVEKSKEKASSDLEFLEQELKARRTEAIETRQEHLLAQVTRGDFRELVDRDGGRRDVRFQLDRFPFISPGLVYNPIVYPLVRELLGGGDVNLLYAGVMWAMPLDKSTGDHYNGVETQRADKDQKLLSCMDTSSQKWHGDGGHLFDHVHLPPHCINVFYPLVDQTKFNGPTEVMPGTHRLGAFSDRSAAKFGLNCSKGDAIIFDYRLKHRGAANFTKDPRPVLYLAYAKPFFRDSGNTRSRQSLIRSTPSSEKITSLPWVARILSGDPVPMGYLEHCAIENNSDDCETSPCADEKRTNDDIRDHDLKRNKSSVVPVNHDGGATEPGSGERWILFKMNVEIPGCDNPKVVTVHHGDIALEVSAQFCRENELSEEFVPVLGESIQSQIDAAKI